ncbi:MAG: hypothetical protein ABUS79_14955 [Pseudomonadota bacterium]
MRFNEADLERAKGHTVSLTLRYDPLRRIEGRLIGWSASELKLDTGTVKVTPSDDTIPEPDSDGRTPVLLGSIVGASL